MSGFFSDPYLPDNKLRLAVCGKHPQYITEDLKSLGIRLITADDNRLLDTPIKNHIDLFVHNTGKGNIIISRGYDELYKIFRSEGLNVIIADNVIKSPHPDDCALNCFRAGEYLFCKRSITDKRILESYNDLIIADVKQGYCKCSTLILDNRAFITDDVSVYKKGKSLSFNCLLIEKGDILLDGYNYGFIGGASAKIDKDTVLFFGDITKHKSFDLIDSFIKSNRMNYIYSKDYPLTDIGGIIPIK